MSLRKLAELDQIDAEHRDEELAKQRKGAVMPATYTPWAVHFFGQRFEVRRERMNVHGAVYVERDGMLHARVEDAIERAERMNEANQLVKVRIAE